MLIIPLKRLLLNVDSNNSNNLQGVWMSKLGQEFYKTLVTNISQSDIGIGPIHVYVSRLGNQLATNG